MGPLQIKLNLPDQWETVGIGYVQLLHFTYTIFLQKHIGNDPIRHTSVHNHAEFEMEQST